MRLNQLFPKIEMNEIFNQFGFERQKPTDGILFKNNYVAVNIYRHRFKKEMFFLTSNAFSLYGIKIDGYKREWNDEEAQECIRFVKDKFLPQIYNLKGPYKMEPDYYFRKVDELFNNQFGIKGKKGNQDFPILFGDTERLFNYDYLKFIVGENKELFFLNKGNMYDIYITEKNQEKKMLSWYDFVDKDKDGEELFFQMIKNIATFLKIEH